MIRYSISGLLLMTLCLVTVAGNASDSVTGSSNATSAETLPLEGLAEQGADYTGVWQGRCLFSKVEAHIRHEGDRIHGVALVRSITGSVDPYHFKGEVTDGKVVASHFRGHTFEGEIISDNEIRGAITTAKKGYVFKLKAKKVSDTPTRE